MPHIPSHEEPFSGLDPRAVPLVTDWQAGLETGIAVDRNVKDWAPFLSPGVPQYQPGPHGYSDKVFDTASCVSFASALAGIQAQCNYLLPSLAEAQRYSLTALGFVVDGKFKLSARWLAHVSGTTRDGNSFARVLEAVRTYGMVPDADWPFEKSLRTFEEWIARPERYDELARKGQAWLAAFRLEYDWLFWDGLNLSAEDKLSRIRAAIADCPVLVGRPWCPSCNPSQVSPGVPIRDCGKVTAGHATCVVRMQPDLDQEVRDTYPIYDRVFDDGFHVHHAFRAVVTARVPKPPLPKPATPVAMCELGDRTQAVAALQNALEYLGYQTAKSPAGAPYFGLKTQEALGKFQAASGIYPTAPDSFGPKSLAAMQKALA